MLEDSLFESGGRKHDRKPVPVVLSAIVHVGTIALLVLIPLTQTQAINIPPIGPLLLAPRMETSRPLKAFSAQPHVQESSRAAPSLFSAPASIPERIAAVDEPGRAELALLPSASGNRFGVPSLDVLNAGGGTARKVAEPVAPVPPPPPPIVKADPIRRGGNVQAANLIYKVNPAYPPLARQARLQGAVVLEALINKEGSIESLRIVTGHPLLNQAALDAVKQWKYRPTMLNGEPVEVITVVTVTFSLR